MAALNTMPTAAPQRLKMSYEEYLQYARQVYQSLYTLLN